MILLNLLVQVIKAKHDIDFDLSTFDKFFGVPLDKYITFICLCLKYYISMWVNFRTKKPTFISFKTFLDVLKDTEYYIAKKKGKLSAHFKKWRFEM